jgi:hypothetical protein
MTKLCGGSTHLPVDEEYVSNRDAPFPACFGGDPSLCGKTHLTGWLASVQLDPMPIQYAVGATSELVTDPAVKANLEAAVKQWVAGSNTAWDGSDKCPVCARGGICAKPSTICQCPVHAEGNACSKCTAGWTPAAKTTNCASPIW